jgi:hypothetical protein
MSRLPERSPSGATERFAADLSARSDTLRLRIAVDFTLVDALVRLGHTTAALRALDEHRAALHAFAEEVSALLACATDARDRTAAPAALRVPGRVLGRVLVAGVAAAAVVGALLLPGIGGDAQLPAPPAEDLVAQVQLAAARQRLAALQRGSDAPRAAVDVTAAVREVHDEILALPRPALTRSDVRAEIDELLTTEQRTLTSLAARDPHNYSGTQGLLQEIRALRVTLALPPRLIAVPTPSATVSLPVTAPAVSPRVEQPSPARP